MRSVWIKRAHGRDRVWVIFPAILFMVGIILLVGYGVLHRQHGSVVVSQEVYEESARELYNPWRGFYRIYGFVVTDEEKDFGQDFLQRTGGEEGLSLLQIQIHLGNYSEGPISDAGMKNIAEIFKALRLLDKQYIIRFLYDWEGRSLEAEPRDREIILTHMGQLEAVLRDNADIILAHQGIFVGNCGEMNGSEFLSTEDMQVLMEQLALVTEESTYLAVRTPAQWRKITGVAEPGQDMQERIGWTKRLGLYNDGIMGTELDYGTYGIHSKTQIDPFGAWNRQEELEFQQGLSKRAPNGGEVIVENPVNDLENAITALRTMGITYLNRDYDGAVLEKWAASTVKEEGCYRGMNGLDYVERHLGYRFFLENVALEYDIWRDRVEICLDIRNVGYAPMYREADLYLVLQNKTDASVLKYRLEEELGVLSGGNDSHRVLEVSRQVQLAGWQPGEYEVYFYMEEPLSGWRIELANAQEQSLEGYLLGTIQVKGLLQ